jgi:hypothetical protein
MTDFSDWATICPERRGEGLDPLVREAVQTLRVKQSNEAGYFG